MGLCCIANILQYSVFVEFSRMLTSRLKECKGCESGNPLAGVFLLREERNSRVICLIWKRCLLARGTRVRPLRPFPTVHPVMCAFFLACMFCYDVCCSPALGLLETSPFLCLLRLWSPLGQPLSYGCWYWPVGTLWFSEPKGMRSIYVIHQPFSYWCRGRPVGMLCIYVFPPALEL